MNESNFIRPNYYLNKYCQFLQNMLSGHVKQLKRSVLVTLSVLVWAFSVNPTGALASASADEPFNISETLIHHVMDTHNWHIVGNIEIPLPWILYNNQKGLEVFMLSGHGAEQVNASALERGYAFSHEKLYPILKDKTVLDSNGKPLPEFSAYFEDKPNAEGKWVLKKDQHEVVQAGKNFYAVDKSVTVIDFSITKTVLQMMIVALVMLLVFTSVASAYKRNAGKAPSGFQAIVEPIIVFVRDEIAKPNLHGKHEPFVPYLLTLFFFIWFSNIFGLTPFNSNISGNISITVALATLTFIITQFNGTKDYWGHIFWFPGVPLPVKFIMLPVEVVGLFTRPFSLTVRLFANIAAGHFMVLALICLIFLMADNGKNPGAAFGIAPLSLVFGLFIMTLEVLVAAIQAYVFTLLSSVFIGMAMESHSHDHAHDAHH